MVVPVLIYESENWALNNTDRRWIETTEIQFLQMFGHSL
jgi:hypothetical protein